MSSQGEIFRGSAQPIPAPHLAPFEYSVIEQDSIRLVHILEASTADDIHLSLEHQAHYFTDDVCYFGLSYCWGEPALTNSVALNGRQFPVTSNLWQALRDLLRLDRTQKYWVDAICINQNDIDERNAQVQQMWRIFASAEKVIAWLGAQDEDSAIAFTAFADAEAEYYETRTYVDKPWLGSSERFEAFAAPANVQRAITSLACRPYFERAWIIPEFLQAKDIQFVCGSLSAPWALLHHFLTEVTYPDARPEEPQEHTLRRRQSSAFAAPASFPVLCQSLLESRAMLGMFRYLRGMKAYNVVFHDVLASYSRRQSSDFRDRIFAFLGDPRIRQLGACIDLAVNYRVSAEQLCVSVAEQYCVLQMQSHSTNSLATFAEYTRFSRTLDTLASMLGTHWDSPILNGWLREQASATRWDEKLHGYAERKSNELLDRGVSNDAAGAGNQWQERLPLI